MPIAARSTALCLILAFMLTGCGLLLGEETLESGKKAPDFTLLPLRGEAVQLEGLRGRPVLLNFWATWCPPCRGEMPALQKIYENYTRKGLVVLTISNEARETLITYAQENDLSLPVLVDMEGKTSTAYRVRSIPTTYFIDAEGVIRAVFVGGLTDKQFSAEAEKLLAASPAATEKVKSEQSYESQRSGGGVPSDKAARQAAYTPPPIDRPAPYQPGSKNLQLADTPNAATGVLPTPTIPFAGPLRGCVLSSVLKAHEIPSQESRTIAWLEAGECRSFHARTTDGVWVRFFHPELNQRLWVVAFEVQFSGDVMSLPIEE